MGLGKEVRPLFTAETAKRKAYRKQERQALVCPTGFEPAAFGVGVLSSIHNVRKMCIFVENQDNFSWFCVYYLRTKVLTC